MTTPRRPLLDQECIALLLFCALACFKLGGVIDWSWWWVTLPLWGGLAVLLAVFVAGTIVLGGASVLAGVVEVIDRRLLR